MCEGRMPPTGDPGNQTSSIQPPLGRQRPFGLAFQTSDVGAVGWLAGIGSDADTVTACEQSTRPAGSSEAL